MPIGNLTHYILVSIDLDVGVVVCLHMWVFDVERFDVSVCFLLVVVAHNMVRK